MAKKSNWVKINSCYKKSIKKYNRCIQKRKCSMKKCEKNCWKKGKTNYKKCTNKNMKKKKGGADISGSLLQLNVNGSTYKFPIFYFPNAINSANQMNSGNNNNNIQWNNWYGNYMNNNNPNSKFGSLTLKQSME